MNSMSTLHKSRCQSIEFAATSSSLTPTPQLIIKRLIFSQNSAFSPVTTQKIEGGNEVSKANEEVSHYLIHVPQPQYLSCDIVTDESEPLLDQLSTVVPHFLLGAIPS